MASTTQTIAGFFRTREQGEAAREALISAGFANDQIGFVAGDTRGHTTPKIGPLASTGAESEAVPNAFVGGMVGLAAGVVAVMVPGIGPLLAAGPLAGAIGGLGLGVATGGVIGLLKDYGVSEEEAEFYAEGVKRGGALVTLQRISEEQASKAKEIFERHGAIESEELKS
jgi:hypothetical protein